METAKISLWEVIIGIWILAIVVILGGIFFVPEPLSYALGEIAGSITASGLMVHLYRSIDIELDLPEKKACKKGSSTYGSMDGKNKTS